MNKTTSGGVESRHATVQEDRTRVDKVLPVTADARSTTGQPCAHRVGLAPDPLAPSWWEFWSLKSGFAGGFLAGLLLFGLVYVVEYIVSLVQ